LGYIHMTTSALFQSSVMWADTASLRIVLAEALVNCYFTGVFGDVCHLAQALNG